MHEMSVAQNILEIVHEYVRKEDEPNVRAIKCTMGELAGIVQDSLTFCFSTLVADTPLRQSHLDITTGPITARCNACGKESRLEYGVFVCEWCKSFEIEIISGSELNVIEIELVD
jgi:hydrogenase nickel incorporation protein HypA/HybF